MDNWDEIRTAYQVARMGTVSGAAEVLGVHHATVIRHIDALENRLAVKLFQRHARGYTATDAGKDLLRVAQTTDDQFSQLAGRLRGQREDVTGELVVTSLAGMSPLMVPALIEFQRLYPDIVIRYLTGARLFRLEYGEAHVAVRAGPAPEQPDNVVQAFGHHRIGLYASQSYIERHGKPKSQDELATHRFVGHDDPESRAPFNQWLRQIVPDAALTFRSSDFQSLEQAVLDGAGIGFLPMWQAEDRPDMVEIMPHRKDWQSPLWLVTHMDLHRTTKVQTFLAFLKEHAKPWIEM